MTIIGIILLVLLLGISSLYITSKIGKDKKISDIINEVKADLIRTSENVAELVVKTKDWTGAKSRKRIYYDCRREE